ncbi:2-nitropropane dioxygenase [Clavulina sp. PMI_390]|nr:2-nitropropane dioxygenase [Clavulina sp. PMI_390]
MITTEITKLLGIEHPVLQAGMNVAAGPELAAAVTNAGGLGVIGGLHYSPNILRAQIRRLKAALDDPLAPFGVDLLFPQIGGNARKTNYDYTKGRASELIDVIIEEGTKLFVCAVGVPPRDAVEALHEAGILIMNMVGHPKHVSKALLAGVDVICAQGGEGGGHTGDIPFSILIPACLDAIGSAKSPLTGKPVHLVAAGGIFDGRGLAASLALGAQAVWVGTRFVASEEAGAPRMHKDLVLKAGWNDTVRTLAYSGRPMRVYRTEWLNDWELNRQNEIKQLVAQGVIPVEYDIEKHPENTMKSKRWLMGVASAVIQDVQPAKVIVHTMVEEAEICLQRGHGYIVSSRL